MQSPVHRRLGLSVAVAVLALVAMLGRTAHMLIVPHTVCAAHGLEHVESDEAGSANHSERDALAEDTDRGHAHDDCVLAASSTPNEMVAPVPPCDQLEMLLPRQLGSQMFHRRRGLLLGLAPKTSPPIC